MSLCENVPQQHGTAWDAGTTLGQLPVDSDQCQMQYPTRAWTQSRPNGLLPGHSCQVQGTSSTKETGRNLMDVSSPISSVIPGAYGPVLVALARANVPMSGRQIAGLIENQVSRSRVNTVLRELALSGIALTASHPPAILYQLNRQHVAAPYVEALAGLRHELLEKIRIRLNAWTRPADAALLFGSAARGDGSVASDIDILIVRPDQLNEEGPLWRSQVLQLTDDIHAWSGNTCEILELSQTEIARSVNNNDRLVINLRQDAVPLSGILPSALLRTHQASSTP